MSENAAQLKDKYKENEGEYSANQAIRIHRAISWLARSEREVDDPDVRFILLWVAFNAAYAREFGYEQGERQSLKEFLSRIIECDSDEIISNMLFVEYSGAIRNLLENKFVYDGFWRALRDQISDDKWKDSFDSAKRAALNYVMQRDAASLLSIIMERLYVLRNQLIHGGATHLSDVNRDQVRAGVHILDKLVPLIITVLIERADFDDGAVIFPVVGSGA